MAVQPGAVATRERSLSIIGLTVIAVVAVAASWTVQRTTYNLWGALFVLPVLVALSVPLVRSVARQEGQAMARLVVLALALKPVACLVRYYFIAAVYDSGDALAYANAAERLAPVFRDGVFAIDLGHRVVGTGFIEILTGLVFAVTGRTILGGFLIFAWLGFWGLYLFYRAFRIGYPEGDHRRYALLIFFLPSLVFWPSSIGKEAWMIFTLGLSTWGAARVLTHRPWGYPSLALGLLGVTMVRPHMSALICAGLVVSFLLRRRDQPRPLDPITRVVGLVVMVGLSLLVVGRAERFFGIEDQGLTGVETVFAEAEERTSGDAEGDTSQYDTQPVTSPLDLPQGIVTVLFRPFPFEATNPQQLIGAVEAFALLCLFVASAKRLRTASREIFRQPFLAFAAVYSVLFVVAFSHIANFGVLSRQRSQLFPIVLVFLALPAVKRVRAQRRPVRS